LAGPLAWSRLLVLLVIQVLNVYKPQGLTPYGWRKQEEQRLAIVSRATTPAGEGHRT
jgi:hypothetical protein